MTKKTIHPTQEHRPFEVWETWIDGKRGDAVEFTVPSGTPIDIAEAAANALGVGVSEQLNMRRIA